LQLTTARQLLYKFALPILVIIPWYIQIIYPVAWVANEYYDYPALFAMCIILASMGLTVFDHVVAQLNLQGLRLQLITISIIGLIIFASTWDYKKSFHESYYPWPLIDQPSPYYSARQVAAVNTKHETVLTDLPLTMYYTEATPAHVKQAWWGWSDEDTIKAIESGQFDYIVVTYPPTVDIIYTIQLSGYERIAPGAWRRLSDTLGSR
jgi:hypothetical protein